MSVAFGLHFSCSSSGNGWPELYSAALEQARLAEALGFEFAVVAEHHFMRDGWIPAPMILCGALAAVTSRIQIGTDIVILPLHNPISVAEEILVLDNLSAGRAILGVGLGGRPADFEVYGVPFKQRVGRSEEAMTLIRRLMTEEGVTHAGRYFRVNGATVTPPPVQRPHPPIWYGAIAEPGAARAARLADALVLGPVPDMSALTAMRHAYDAELHKRGSRPVGHVILRREAYVAADAKTAWREATDALRFQYSEVYTKVAAAITDDELRAYARDRFIVGGPAECIAEIKRYQEALDFEAILLRVQLPKLTNEQVLNAVRLLGERVLPHV